MYRGVHNENSISFAYDSNKQFYFRADPFTAEQIGAAIARAIMRGDKLLNLGGASVTPNYLFEMLQFAAREGWFTDGLTDDEGQDHSFDCNEPTPGQHWAKSRQLRKMATEEAALAIRFRSENRPDLAKPHEDMAEINSRQADQLCRNFAGI